MIAEELLGRLEAVRQLRRHYESRMGTAWDRELSLALDRLIVADEALNLAERDGEGQRDEH